MRSILIPLASMVLACATAGCTEEDAEKVADTYYVERTVASIGEWLEDTCAPDNWCEPYADAAARQCIDQHMPFDALMGLTPAGVTERVEQAMPDVQMCVIQEVYARHAQDRATRASDGIVEGADAADSAGRAAPVR